MTFSAERELESIGGVVSRLFGVCKLEDLDVGFVDVADSLSAELLVKRNEDDGDEDDLGRMDELWMSSLATFAMPRL